MWLDVPLARDGQAVRHRVLYGGRGGAKSWTIAHKLVERAIRSPERILCAREYQNSIRDSSKKLLEDTINKMGFGPLGNCFFSFTETEIRGRNGALFTFVGLNGREASIKSFEGYTLAWVEEAGTVRQASIDALIPTIRQRGSEIWWSYNPRYASDPVDLMFRTPGRAPPGSICVEVHWRDNPWFPQVLRRDMVYDLRRDPDKHAHVWEGAYVQRSEAKVFSNWQVIPFATPEDAVIRFGADWGYSQDPTVLVRCFIGDWAGTPGESDVIADPAGRCLFIDQEAYEVGCEVDGTPALFAGSDSRTPPRWLNAKAHPGIAGADRWEITADSARPETISYMRRRGFMIAPAIKGRDSVEDGISFLRSYDIYVHPRCRHAIAELTHYSWKVDRLSGEILPKLADDNNHVIDALRYALEGVRRAGSGRMDWRSAGRRTTLGGTGETDDQIMPGLEPYVRRSSGWGSVPGLASRFKSSW
jgi:phage terminase large subunit